MYFFNSKAAFNNMGYAMSRLGVDSDLLCDSGKSTSEVGGSHRMPNKSLNHLDHEVAQATKLRSAPNEHLTRILPRKREFPVSTVKMLAGREGNYSGRGRVSGKQH
ncbi:hypothetical protein LOK49_LG15G00384 [Camellia lanceoleosa]|uniref:Uncharacterized protein n=1 Tax=Camellia lanceoleosa TaxID=1840588 RepID=A0ACC0F0G3_9ERIC|nr:hypothetical protein LOK49_LG15G00384 [Camellia lanceoleosa]